MFAARHLITGARRGAASAAAATRSKHTLPDLPYDYNALAPVVSAEIMTLHHSKHHNVRRGAPPPSHSLPWLCSFASPLPTLAARLPSQPFIPCRRWLTPLLCCQLRTAIMSNMALAVAFYAHIGLLQLTALLPAGVRHKLECSGGKVCRSRCRGKPLWRDCASECHQVQWRRTY